MNQLTYSKPASVWTESLPLGNGRLGAMHFGGVETDILQLNEDTLWSGPPKKDQVYDDRETLEKVRLLINEEKYEEANEEAKNLFGPYTQAYLPLGNLKLNFLHGNVSEQYERFLDIEKAISSVKYKIGDAVFTRESFISHPHNVLVMKITSSIKGALNFNLTVESLLKSRTVKQNEGEIVLQGICPEYCAPNYFKGEYSQPIVYGEFGKSDAIHFEGRVKVHIKDGQVMTSDGNISVFEATEATIYFSASTSFNGFDQIPGKDFNVLAEQNLSVLDQAMSITYEELKESHIKDYSDLYKRVEFNLKDEQINQGLDTDQRIRKFGAKDLNMVELLFQYGRYLLISSSREGSQPANLQGIWNDSTRAPWSSNYTLNINTEMNYWPAESANLSECHRPLLQAIKELSVTGSEMVRERYGLNGWTANHNTDIWRHAHPVGSNKHGDPIWAYWPMSGPWLTRHLWEHYSYSHDREYLEEVFPIMKGAAEFCLDWLIEDESGYLVTSPSTSPEHKFITEDGQVGAVTKGATMDLQIIWDLFTNYIKASETLGIKDEFIEQVKKAKDRIHPLQIGKYGQLQEWLIDYEDHEPHHRHVSHLYGLYPSNQITDGPLLEAVRQTLNRRGDDGTGWSLGWKMCLWARLKDGERVKSLIDQLFHIVEDQGEVMTGGGIYPNLLGAHPPFQIDGNFSFTAGIIEMLIQSHKEYVELLPALPSTWLNGSMSGIRIEGGFTVSITWNEMRPTKLIVQSNLDNNFTLKSEESIYVQGEDGSTKQLDPVQGYIEIKMNKGRSYTIEFE